MHRIFALCLFLAPLSVSAARVVNLGGEFRQFLADSAGQPAEAVERIWEQYEARHQAIYDEAVYMKSDAGWEKRQRSKRDQFFAKLPQLKEGMLDLFGRADQIVAEKEAQFRQLFPDLAADIPVVFLPSLFSFNGMVRELPPQGEITLLMGVDFIVERRDNLNVLFAHEFFHAYHASKISGPSGSSMATPLWKEGFATYVSGVLNPGEADASLLMQADLASACADARQVSEMARNFLEVLNRDGTVDYKDWFMMSGPTQPVRRGYCVGLQMLRRLAERYSVSEMATWNENRYIPEIRLELEALAAGK